MATRSKVRTLLVVPKAGLKEWEKQDRNLWLIRMGAFFVVIADMALIACVSAYGYVLIAFAIILLTIAIAVRYAKFYLALELHVVLRRGGLLRSWGYGDVSYEHVSARGDRGTEYVLIPPP